MKQNYLHEIRTLMSRYVVTAAEIDDIIADYDRMYEDGLARGLDDAGVIELLGTPEKVVAGLGENYARKPGKAQKNGKIVALSPFLAVIAFFVLGFAFDLWHPGWLVFLAIPVTAILLGGERRRPIEILTALSPFFAVTAFILLGDYYGAWHPAWLVFLAIPILGALADRNWKGRVFALTLAAAAGCYLYVGYTDGRWALGALAFLVPLIYGAAVGAIDIVIDWRGLSGLARPERSFRLAMAGVVVLAAAIYLIVGFAFGWWAFGWLVFLAIPMVAILLKANRKARIVALSPFIATILFFVLGFAFDAWAYAWLAFLLIPMTAIVRNA